MVRRAFQGIPCGNYKQLDYDQLQSMIAEKKFAGQESLVKLRKIESDARLRRDSNLMKQHQNIWNNELLRLRSLREQAAQGIEVAKNSIVCDISDELLRKFYDELWVNQRELEDELDDFRTRTVDPVWQLR